ncbi:hypothetical protein BV25DRAFT_1835159 [Artomyces pyxidatus]|uniref:Uncharacterized protein n=1 Tax=Artomyces pyxidatus TaxID=48021 RepID=A0ACB8TGF8_9AGAM|nr:hypothetical protein BV25DRAFT_1835159 [Artomyces pyxidatus]
MDQCHAKSAIVVHVLLWRPEAISERLWSRQAGHIRGLWEKFRFRVAERPTRATRLGLQGTPVVRVGRDVLEAMEEEWTQYHGLHTTEGEILSEENTTIETEGRHERVTSSSGLGSRSTNAAHHPRLASATHHGRLRMGGGPAAARFGGTDAGPV